jgi:hypothetical protein
MANVHSEKLRGVRRVTDDLWSAFDKSSKAVQSDRSAVLRAFMEWHTGRSEDLPERPPVGAWSTSTDE